MKPSYPFFSLIVLFTIGTLISCQEKDSVDLCGNGTIEEFNLLDSSIDSIPYAEGMDLFFQDSVGNQLVFELHRVYDIGTNTHAVPCEYDDNKQIDIEYTFDRYNYYMWDPTNSLDLNISIGLIVNPFVYEAGPIDELAIFFGEGSSSSFLIKVLNILVDQRELDEQPQIDNSIFIDQIALFDRTFYNVFTNNDSSCYFNYALGIVAFRDFDGILWVLDKTMPKEK